MKNLVAVLMLMGLVGCSKPEAKKDECWTDGKGATKTCLPKPSSVDLNSDVTAGVTGILPVGGGPNDTGSATLTSHELLVSDGGPFVADCAHAKFLTYDVAKHKFSCPVTRFVNTPSKTKAVLKDMQIGAVSHMETPMPAMLASAPSPPDGAYNFILPAKIPGNGIYKCRVRSRVLEFVDLPKESK